MMWLWLTELALVAAVDDVTLVAAGAELALVVALQVVLVAVVDDVA